MTLSSTVVNLSDVGILDPDGNKPNPLTGATYSQTYKDLAKVWSKFPAYKDADKIISDIVSHNVVLVASGTGSGKTVLFPKYVLHALGYNGKVAVTLPKQIITKSAAQFSADCLDVKLGEEVGYLYRNVGKNTVSDKTKLLYCTDGTLVAMLLSDPELKEFDAVLVDEAHERKVNIDFLLYLLKNVLKIRPEFKLIIMSATIDETIFRRYYGEFNYTNLEIGTKPNYPIESIFLSSDLNIDKNEYLKKGIEIIKNIIATAKDTTGILFFVTSVNETDEICNILNDENTFKDGNLCISVYSGMDDEEQKKATDKDYYRQFVGKDGRKIIIATNVAESSLTVEGIGYVIDSGLEIRNRYDPIERVDVLEKRYITVAQARQRMGRTGRTGPGSCYHLYTENTFNNKMDKFPPPAIKTESISYEMIRLMAIPGIDNIGSLKATLNNFIEPPTKMYIDSELKYLYNYNMITSIDNSGVLSRDGKTTSLLQLEPNISLMLTTAFKLNCFREVVAIVSVIDSIKGSLDQLFTLPIDILDDVTYNTSDKNKDQKKLAWLMKKFDDAKNHFSNKYGDHIVILKIFSEYEKHRGDHDKLKEWSYKYFIKRDVLERAYDTYTKLKHRYRHKISSLDLPKPSSDILNKDLKYRVMASLLAGAKTSRAEIDVLKVSKGKLITVDNSTSNIQLDKITFVEAPVSKSSRYFYHKLHRFNNNPVKAKIVTKVSNNAEKILDATFRLDI